MTLTVQPLNQQTTLTGVAPAPTYYGTNATQDANATSWTTTPPTTTTTSPTNTTTTNNTATTSPNYAVDTAAINNTQGSLDQLPGILAAALAANDQTYANAGQGFNAQETQQRGQYDTGTTTNQQNYDANLMAALRSGASGLGGLLSILRGTGVENWARQAVGDTTNSDIRTGLDTRNQNQTGLDTSLSSFLTDLADKRHQNDVTHQNNEFAARGNNATQMQDLYTKLAGYYADMGDNANATRYMDMAGSQTPAIAQYGTAPVAAYNMTPAVVHAAPVSAFAAPTDQPVTVNPGDSSPSSSIFTLGDARKRLAGA